MKTAKKFNQKEFNKVRSAEMHCAVHDFNISWNKLTERSRLPLGYMIFRFPNDIFCIVEHHENPKRIISLFFDQRLQCIKNLEDFKAIQKFQDISTLIKILGSPTHWRILDLEIPEKWNSIN